MFFISILLLITWTFQEINNRNISFNKDLKLKKEQNKRDTKITNGINKGVENTTEKIFDGLSIAFAKQGFQYDTIRKEVSRLKDSIKTLPVEKDPLLIINNIKIKDSVLGIYNKSLKITFESVGSSSYDINLQTDIYGIDVNENIITSQTKINMITSKSTLSETQFTNYNVMLNHNNSINNYVFYIYGYYKKLSGKIIKVNRFYSVDVKTSILAQPLDNMERKLKEYINQSK